MATKKVFDLADVKKAKKMTKDEYLRLTGKPSFGQGRENGYVIDMEWYSEEQYNKIKADSRNAKKNQKKEGE